MAEHRHPMAMRGCEARRAKTAVQRGDFRQPKQLSVHETQLQSPELYWCALRCSTDLLCGARPESRRKERRNRVWQRSPWRIPPLRYERISTLFHTPAGTRTPGSTTIISMVATALGVLGRGCVTSNGHGPCSGSLRARGLSHPHQQCTKQAAICFHSCRASE